jgi:ribosomal protein S18 acetylase RimI-like enzyme
MNSSNIEYRIKTASYESIVEHLSRSADCFHPPLYTYVDIEKYAKKIFDNAITFESWHCDALVGLVAAYFNNNATKAGFITDVSVLKEYQSFGIASELIETAIHFGRDNAFVKLVLEVNVSNRKALKLYEKHGFVPTKQNGNKIVMTHTILTGHNESR